MPPARRPIEPSAGPILVVEDDDEHRDALAELFRLSGFETWTAGDGADALRTLDSMPTTPGLIVLDLDMPVMTGRELLAELRAHPGRRTIPVVITSGSGSRDGLAGLPFFAKPLAADALLEAVHAVLAPDRRT